MSHHWCRLNAGLTKLTAEEAAAVERDRDCNISRIRPNVPILTDPGEDEWFLSPENAEKKDRGEKYMVHYLGNIITIV
jgi:hypothetical protein